MLGKPDRVLSANMMPVKGNHGTFSKLLTKRMKSFITFSACPLI